MKDCTTCKYGYEDERLGIPMFHHPKRFSEDCVDFNMHEEKETEESEIPNDLEEAVEKQIDEALFKWSYDDEDGIEQYVHDAFIAVAKWDRSQMLKEAVEVQVVGEQRDLRLIDSTQRCLFDAKRGDWLKIIIVKED